MKLYNYTIPLVGIIISFLTGCNRENNFNEGETAIKHSFISINIYYAPENNRNLILPDSNSKVFLYMHDYDTGYSEYSYDLDTGVFTNETDTIYPVKRGITNKEGAFIMDIRPLNIYREPCMFTVVSNHYKRITMNYPPVFTPWEKYEIKILFNP
jgi:hypothetical protein